MTDADVSGVDDPNTKLGWFDALLVSILIIIVAVLLIFWDVI